MAELLIIDETCHLKCRSVLCCIHKFSFPHTTAKCGNWMTRCQEETKRHVLPRSICSLQNLFINTMKRTCYVYNNYIRKYNSTILLKN